MARASLVVIAIVLPGCGLLLDLDGSDRDDADAGASTDGPAFDTGASPPPCTGPWTSITQVTELNSTRNEYGPSLSGDGLVIYFNSDRADGVGHDIFVATRATRADAFTAPVVAAELSTAFQEGDPSISSDGLTIYFDSNRSGAYTLYRATRPSTDDAFGPPSPVPFEPFVAVPPEPRGPDVSADERELFFGAFPMGRATLFVAVRAGPSVPFPIVVSIVAPPDTAWPSISADGLALYAQSEVFGTSDIGVAVRPNRETVSFGSMTPVVEITTADFSERDPEISADGSELFFASDRGGVGQFDVWVARRRCGP